MNIPSGAATDRLPGISGQCAISERLSFGDTPFPPTGSPKGSWVGGLAMRDTSNAGGATRVDAAWKVSSLTRECGGILASRLSAGLVPR